MPLMVRMEGNAPEPQKHDVKCGECRAPMVLRHSSRFNVRGGMFYGCSRYPECKGTHGAHEDGTPLGIPADKETKAKRMEAHEAFDRLWKYGGMRRGEAYVWMQKALNMTPDEAHIGRFTIQQCDALIKAIDEKEEETGWD